MSHPTLLQRVRFLKVSKGFLRFGHCLTSDNERKGKVFWGCVISMNWVCLADLQLRDMCSSKCFTYVAKTIANSTTYSRKPGDYNGTIIFEFDIMKNLSPLNLKLTFFATVKTKITLLFCWTHSTVSSASKCDRVNQNKRNNQKICEKVKFDKDLNWLGTSFSWYQSQK